MTTEAPKPVADTSRGGRRRPAKAPAPALVPASAPPSSTPSESAPSKLTLILALLGRTEGASLAEMTAVTGWQPHSVRGALAGALKRKGHVILSEKVDGARRYRIGAAQ